MDIRNYLLTTPEVFFQKFNTVFNSNCKNVKNLSHVIDTKLNQHLTNPVFPLQGIQLEDIRQLRLLCRKILVSVFEQNSADKYLWSNVFSNLTRGEVELIMINNEEAAMVHVVAKIEKDIACCPKCGTS